MTFSLGSCRIAVVGLGYVGLPLACEFAKKYPVVGFDIDERRIAELILNQDRTNEVSEDDLTSLERLQFSNDAKSLFECNVFIITVPTPIDDAKKPDLTAIKKASQLVGHALSANDVVVFESTVYPGLTEEVCAPILEASSGLKVANEDVVSDQQFFIGYSPERINPGDKERKITDIIKVTSGCTEMSSRFIDNLYQSVITAGTHRVSGIRIAEAAKVIENVQRDVNIALINELSVLFGKLGLDTSEILEAASTKWNFLPFKPGLVGGHCIGVDPYYLTYKAKQIGYQPDLILAGRKLNDSMSKFVADSVCRLMAHTGAVPSSKRALILGYTFKENCPDIRNSKVFDLMFNLAEQGIQVHAFDCLADYGAVPKNMRKFVLSKPPKSNSYDAVVLAVPHDEFVARGAGWVRAFGSPGHIFFDMKSAFRISASDGRL